jgi:acetamidase/formamidase
MRFFPHFNVATAAGIRFPRIRIPPRSLTPRVAYGRSESTLGIRPDVTRLRDAVRGMLDLLQARGYSREEGDVLCSLAADLKITESLDAPNWIVAAFVPRPVLSPCGTERPGSAT